MVAAAQLVIYFESEDSTLGVDSWSKRSLRHLEGQATCYFPCNRPY